MDINRIEGVQKRFTRACLPRMTYAERRSRLDLQTLETRRVINDLTMCYKLNSKLDMTCQVLNLT